MLKRQSLLCSCVILFTACGGSSGEDSSFNSSNSSSSSALTVPQNLSATPGNTTVALDWSTVVGASTYYIFYATEPDIQSNNINAFENGTWIQNVMPPYQINSLTNGETYYFVVTAVKDDVESAQSSEVSTTPSVVDFSLQPTAQEVLVLELVNRARFDPDAEAARYNIDLNDGIGGTPISSARKPPLAHNLFLIKAARAHSQWMLDKDIFSHSGAEGNTPSDRMAGAGYLLTGGWATGENIAWSGTSGDNINLTDAAYGHHEGLFKSPGHRENILSTTYRELGIGHKDGYFNSSGKNWRASMLTQNFARSGPSYFLTGVVYEDSDSDEFYDIGEGISGITITLDGRSHTVFSTGAYAVPVTNGTYAVTLTGAALGAPISHSIEINGANVKLDLIKSGSNVEINTW